MGTVCFEIERKWVGGMDESLITLLEKEAKEAFFLEQGYFPSFFSVQDGYFEIQGVRLSLSKEGREKAERFFSLCPFGKKEGRYRLSRSIRGEEAVLTFKSAEAGLYRLEEEFPVPCSFIESLRPYVEAVLKKRRWRVFVADRWFDVDTYPERPDLPFIVVEAEFLSEQEARAFSLPSFFLPFNLREETGNPAFSSRRLALAR